MTKVALLRRFVVAIVVLLASSCASPPSPSPPPQQSASVPQWQVDVSNIRENTTATLTVRDSTGIVADVRAAHATMSSAGTTAGTLSAELRSGGGQVLLSWTTTRCVESGLVSIVPRGEVLVIQPEPQASVDCDPIAVDYSFELLLRRPVDIARVVLEEDGVVGRSWGLWVSGTDNHIRSVTVLDETRLSVGVDPVHPGSVAPSAVDAEVALDPTGNRVTLSWRSQGCHDRMNIGATRDSGTLQLAIELQRSVGAPPCGGVHGQALAIQFSPSTRWESAEAALHR